MSVQLFFTGLEACAIFRSLGRVNLRDCAMIPLRLGFPLICIAGSLELILTCIYLALLSILSGLHMQEHAVNTIYKEYLCYPFF